MYLVVTRVFCFLTSNTKFNCIFIITARYYWFRCYCYSFGINESIFGLGEKPFSYRVHSCTLGLLNLAAFTFWSDKWCAWVSLPCELAGSVSRTRAAGRVHVSEGVIRGRDFFISYSRLLLLCTPSQTIISMRAELAMVNVKLACCAISWGFHTVYLPICDLDNLIWGFYHQASC